MLVIYDHESGAQMLAELRGEVASRHWSHRITLLDEPGQLAGADRVLVLLSRGVLKPGSTSLKQLEEVARAQEKAEVDQGAQGNMKQVVMAYNEEAGWEFGGIEHRNASKIVTDTLNDHEAITYRPQTQGGVVTNFQLCSIG